MKLENKTTSYTELASSVGDMILANKLIPQTNKEFDSWELFCGDDYEECEVHGNNECECDITPKEFYQNYVITKQGAEYLRDHTNECVMYNSELDLYVWQIDHFGTPWSGVFTKIKK